MIWNTNCTNTVRLYLWLNLLLYEYFSLISDGPRVMEVGFKCHCCSFITFYFGLTVFPVLPSRLWQSWHIMIIVFFLPILSFSLMLRYYFSAKRKKLFFFKSNLPLVLSCVAVIHSNCENGSAASLRRVGGAGWVYHCAAASDCKCMAQIWSQIWL